MKCLNIVVIILGICVTSCSANWLFGESNDTNKGKEQGTEFKEEQFKQWVEQFSNFIREKFQNYDSFRDWANQKGEEGKSYLQMIPDLDTFTRWSEGKFGETKEWAKQKLSEQGNLGKEYRDWMANKAQETKDWTEDKAREAGGMTKEKAIEMAQSIAKFLPDYDTLVSWAKTQGVLGQKIAEMFPDYNSFSTWLQNGLQDPDGTFQQLYSTLTSKSKDEYESFRQWAVEKGEQGVELLRQVPDGETFQKWVEEVVNKNV